MHSKKSLIACPWQFHEFRQSFACPPGARLPPQVLAEQLQPGSAEYTQSKVHYQHQLIQEARRKARRISSLSGVVRFPPSVSRQVLAEQLELPRLRQALERIAASEVIHSAMPRPGPLAFPLLVERLNNRMSNESVLERVQRLRDEAIRRER